MILTIPPSGLCGTNLLLQYAADPSNSRKIKVAAHRDFTSYVFYVDHLETPFCSTLYNIFIQASWLDQHPKWADFILIGWSIEIIDRFDWQTKQTAPPRAHRSAAGRGPPCYSCSWVGRAQSQRDLTGFNQFRHPLGQRPPLPLINGDDFTAWAVQQPKGSLCPPPPSGANVNPNKRIY